jgi:hypothetical protein
MNQIEKTKRSERLTLTKGGIKMTESLRDRIKKIVRDRAAKQTGYAPSLDETVDRIMNEIRKS